MTPAIQKAIEEIRKAYPHNRIDAEDDGNNGAYVKVHDVPLEGPFHQVSTWVGFQITNPYPYCDIYPLFVRADLSRRDGNALGEGLSVGNFRSEVAVQISRRSNRHNPAVDKAVHKLLKVIKWLNSL